MREELIELRCLHFLHVLQSHLPNLEVVPLVGAHRLKNLIDELLMSGELVELSDGFNLTDDVLFKEELKQPVVVLLFDLDLADVLHVRVDSDP